MIIDCKFLHAIKSWIVKFYTLPVYVSVELWNSNILCLNYTRQRILSKKLSLNIHK